MNHFGPGIRLLMAAGQRHREEFADRVIAAQNAARVFPCYSRTGFRLGPRHLAVFAFAQRALGDEIKDAAGIVVAGEPVLHGGVLHFRIFMDDDFNHRRMQLIAVAYRRRAAFDIAHIATLVGDQNRTFKLAGFLGVDTEIGRQLHRTAHTFRHVDKGAIGSDRGVQRSEEVVVARHHGTEILFHQFRMIVNRFAKGAEDDPLLRQLLAIGGCHRYRVENGVHRDFFAFAYRYPEQVKGFLDFICQEGVCPGLLHRAGLRGAGLVAVAAGWRRVVAVILIIQLIVMRFQPVRLLHLLPGLKGVETKFEHPLRFITTSGNRAYHLFINAFGQLIGL